MTKLPPTKYWAPESLFILNEHFSRRPVQDLLYWAAQIFDENVALGTGFGPSGVVLLHLTSQLRQRPIYFYIDTGILFRQTYQLRDRLEERLGIRFVRVDAGLSLEEQARRHGSRLWASNPNACCHLRKVLPLKNFLADKSAWLTGVRRDQSPTRAQTKLLEWNSTNQVLKLNPLALWTEDQVWDYIHRHDLPYHPLHDEGYPSLGCVPCTRAVKAGEPKRAGRWAGTQKMECGIHIENGIVVRTSA